LSNPKCAKKWKREEKWYPPSKGQDNGERGLRGVKEMIKRKR